ncbi:MAG TPA: outer membrane beta-barrel protein [Chitinophagales bacterium]|nr:outer membrane beta-barrel protein [Chitinophagales bacterium]
MKTRHLLLTGLMTLGLTSSLFAQERDNNGGFGIKGGVGFSTISFGEGKDIEKSDNSWKVGGMFGVSYEARIGNVFALDFEALLANKGVKRTQSYTILGKSGDVTLKGNLFTVDVPISAKFYFGDNFNIYAGPYFSYTLGANTKASASYGDNTQSKESENWFGNDYKDPNGELPLNRFDIGANVGLEFISNGGFGIGARFQKGFIDITNDDYVGRVNGDVGLVFPADKKFVTNTGFQLYGIFRF